MLWVAALWASADAVAAPWWLPAALSGLLARHGCAVASEPQLLRGDIDDQKNGHPHHQGNDPVHALLGALGWLAIPAGVFLLPVGIAQLRLSTVSEPIAILYSHDPHPFLWRLVCYLLEPRRT